MQRTAIALCLGLALIAALAGTAAAQYQPGPEFGNTVQQAITSTQDFLWSTQQPDGSWPSFEGHENVKGGQTALVTYALMESGVSPQDERIQRALNFLLELGDAATFTYALGLRANVWYVANRTTADRYLRPLQSDAGRLGQRGRGGFYSYEGSTGSWDASNDQYGVLGMWAAARNGLPVPDAYWTAVMRHWKQHQNADGGWGYHAGAPYVQFASRGYYGNGTQETMAVGGLATLYICVDNLPSSSAVLNCQGGQQDPAIDRALQWMNNNFAQTVQYPDQALLSWYFYYMYGVERAALASGYKYFGGVDWYRTGIASLLRYQQNNGSFYAQGILNDAGPVIGQVVSKSAFALLFMIRGQQPVLFNKLAFDGDWNNRPRDLASVTRWLNSEYESNVNWQIVDLSLPVSEWRDAPIMYISGNDALQVGPAVVVPGADAAATGGQSSFTDENIAKLRQYVYQGGTIVTVNECNSAAFTESVKRLSQKLFPEYAFTVCPPEHPIYDCETDLNTQNVTFSIVSNGVRPLLIHTDIDLVREWQKGYSEDGGANAGQAWAYDAAANIVAYALDGVAGLPARATSVWPSVPPVPGLGEGTGMAGIAGGGGGGAAPVPVAPAPVAQQVDWIYLYLPDGQIIPARGQDAGLQGQVGNQTITVPRPTDPGRVTVVAPNGLTINIPENQLGQQVQTPDGQVFLAQRPAPQAPAAPVAPGAQVVVNTPTVIVPGGRISIVRVQYNGNWNPEPLAYERFAYMMGTKANTSVDVAGPVTFAQLPNQPIKLAVLTGTEALVLTPAEIDALKTFITNGGTVFIDFAGGKSNFRGTPEGEPTFHDSVVAITQTMFPDKRLLDLSGASPLYTIQSADITEVLYRRRTALAMSGHGSQPTLKAVILDNDRPGIIYSQRDITGGLVGYESYAVDGYAPVSAFQVLRNVVLYAGR